MSSYGMGTFTQHQALLAASAISPEVARGRGYVSVDTKTRLAGLGFADYQRRTPGLLIPLHDPTGEPAGFQYRPDDPRTDGKDRPVKYESLPGSTPVLDVPPIARPWLRSAEPLWITEGARKADALATLGIPAVSLAGVAGWQAGGMALPAWSDLRLRGRSVIVAFDSDVMTKASVRRQLDALAAYLAGRGATVRRCLLPSTVDGCAGKVGVDDYLAAGHTRTDLQALVVTDDPHRPIPLSPPRTAATFPVDALPGWAGSYVDALSTFCQTPADLAGACVLGVLAACAGGRAVVEARPGWREPTNLYLLPVLPPGARKSAVISAATRPLYEAERALHEQMRGPVIEAATTKDIAIKAAEKARQNAARATPDQRDTLLAEAIAAASAAEAVDVPCLPRLIADDVTPEAAASMLAEHGGRLAIISAEGGIFDTLAGRYSGGVPQLDVWLKGHAGDPLRVDRKGRPSEYVDAPALTMLLTAQPAVLAAIAHNGTFRGRGLLARLLYAVPANNVGRRRIGSATVPAEVADCYAVKVRELAERMVGWTDAAVLTLDPAAQDLLLRVERQIEPQLAPDGTLGGIAEWGSKLVGAVLRVAGLLHLAAGPDALRRPISSATLNDAVRIGAYFTEHARAAFDLLGEDSDNTAAGYLLDHLRRKAVESFTLRALFTELPRGRFGKVEQLAEAVDTLDAHGWVTRMPTPPREGPGRRPSPAYAVHPLTFAAESAESAETPTRPHSADSADNAATSTDENAA